MSYRARLAAKEARSREQSEREREDRVCYAEPDLRDYEAAYRAVYGRLPAKLNYSGGWVRGLTPGASGVRLVTLRAMTRTLWAKVHEAEILEDNI